MKKYAQQGFGIIEIMVAVAVVIFGFTAILELFRLNVQSSMESRENLQAYALLAEALEAARSVRDGGWSNFSSFIPGVDYYPVITGGAWALQTTNPGSINGFSRRVVLSQARRDASSNIVASAGTVDPDTLGVTAYIEWQGRGGTKIKNLTTYLTNWQGKL
jgi:type II secretory pathway pseudopilin PulG